MSIIEKRSDDLSSEITIESSLNKQNLQNEKKDIKSFIKQA